MQLVDEVPDEIRKQVDLLFAEIDRLYKSVSAGHIVILATCPMPSGHPMVRSNTSDTKLVTKFMLFVTDGFIEGGLEAGQFYTKKDGH